MKKAIAFLAALMMVFTACIALAAELPVKSDYPAGPQWDPAEEPTRSNGSWAQSCAVFEELEKRAAEYSSVQPEVTLTLAVHDPASSGPGENATAWANAVTVATEGRVRVIVGHGGTLSPTMSEMDNLLSGTVDVIWTLPCYFKGYMPMTNVVQNPALGILNGTAGSHATWELYKESETLQAESARIGKLLYLCVNCTSPLSYKGTGEITSISEIKGNIRANNGPAQDFVTAIGANVYGCPIGEVYSNVSHGIIDWLITDWNGIDSFALSDPGVLNYYLDTNIGSSAFALIMNQDVWDGLAPDLQEAVLAASGDYMLNVAGIWDYWEACGYYHAIQNGGTIYVPSESLAAELQAVYEDVVEIWINNQKDPAAARLLYEAAKEKVAAYNALEGEQ